MRAPESLIPVLEQLCTVLEQLCQVEADKLTVISADHPDQLESLLNDENMLLLQLRGLDKKRSDLLRRSGLGFSSSNVTVEIGDTKKSVLVTDYVTPVNAMEQLYMTVIVQ